MNWKLFQVYCCLQIILASIHSLVSFIGIFTTSHPLYFILCTLAYALIAWLAVFGLSLYNNLFPDQPITGIKKKLFNRLFIINFLLTIFLFGLLFSEINTLKEICQTLNLSFSELPFSFYIQFIAYLLMLIFHSLILYGMFHLRITLYRNYRNKKFEFENPE